MGIHGLFCRKSAGRQIRHSTISDIIWRAKRQAGVPSMKELSGLLQDDGKRPDGVTMIPSARGRCLAWDVTVSDTFLDTHLPLSSLTPSASDDKAAAKKTSKYQLLVQTHIFTPIAIETTGAFNADTLQLLQKIGRWTKTTGDIKETAYLFQQISVAIQRGNVLSTRGTLISAT